MAGKQRIRLSDSVIARLRPREREYTVWDTRVGGLGVRVRSSGGASFVFLRKVEGRSKRLSLGPVTAYGIEDVRRRCHALMASTDPEATDDTAHRSPLFRDFVLGPWKDAHFPRYKPSTRKSVHYSLVSQLLPAFGSTPLRHINRNQVLRWFDTYSQSAPGGANFAFGVLRQILNFAVACDHISATPAQGIRTNRRTALTRFLSREELGRLHQALEERSRRGAGPRQQADIIRLLLFTGCRKSEVLKLRWSEVTPDTLVLGDSKTGPRTVPLNARARRILGRQPRGRSEFVFPSPQNVERPRARDLPLWYSLRRDTGLEDVRLHDLRHTVASHAAMNGVPVPVVSRLLGHANVRMTLRYSHLSDREIEAAAERIGAAMARTMALTQRKSEHSGGRIHDLRHSFASHAVKNGVPVPVVSRLLGHSDVLMTLRYAHLADKDIEAAAERIGEAMAQVMAIDGPEPDF